jgi:hypothetical protein
LELAQWIANSKHPLTARVMVNRIWQRMMGQGLVSTPNDFGAIGERPTHPELLDYLADRFVNSGWSIKQLIREIAMSRTYRQSTVADPNSRQLDPENKLLARMPIKRLSYEQLLDSLLAVGDCLTYGPPGNTGKRPPNGYPFRRGTYRTLYVTDDTIANLFDGPERELIVEARGVSITSPQMLFFLNNRIVLEITPRIAERAKSLANSPDLEETVAVAYRILLSRTPTKDEVNEGKEFARRQSLERFCHLLLCSNEFMYLD